MLYRAPGTHSPIQLLTKLFCALWLLALIACAARTPAQDNSGLRFDLPANGNLRIENLRGAVIAEVWAESYVSVRAISDSGQRSTLSPVVERSDGLLSIRMARAAAGVPRTNLEVRVPSRSHLAMVTLGGAVSVTGVPAALLVQTGSGEIRWELPADARSTVIADSRTGAVSSSIAGLRASRSASPQL